MIPENAEAIDAAWLGAVLSIGRNPVNVSQVRHETVVHGAGTKICLAIDYARGGETLPSRI